MGLDMYLTKNRPGTDKCELLGYWRTANHVHGWFERNTSDGYFRVARLGTLDRIRIKHRPMAAAI